MEKKSYETPRLNVLGTVQELTALVADCGGSADTDFTTSDGICCLEECE